jgi:S-adenosylmethionine-diacylglycerol 3-amino-3-carboxypropyl transferase
MTLAGKAESLVECAFMTRKRLVDAVYQRVFSHLFVYNILFEDSEVDERFLGLDESSTVLGISGAGCRIAGHLSERPRHIDAVDINCHHLALTGLKVQAAQGLRSYDEFYDLFGRGSVPNSGHVVGNLAAGLPAALQRHLKRHRAMFSEDLFTSGLTARLLRMLQRLAGVDEGWLRSLMTLDVSARRRLVLETFRPVLTTPWVKCLLESPLHLVSIGVNYAQCERMLRIEGMADIGAFLLMHLQRVAATDVARNWFAWYAIVGHYNHEDQKAIPPFLRKDHHERSRGSSTSVAYHHRSIFDVLDEAQPSTWSHFTLCDAPDWMSDSAQKRLFQAVIRAGRDGGVLQYRTVERTSLVERHGLADRLQPMVAETEMATALDRTCQFGGVRYYRIMN